MSKSTATIVIESGKKDKNYWRDLFAYRELFYFLAWRDIKVRYKQTVLGISWSVIRPFLTLVVFTILFGKMAGLSSGNTPYALVVCAGLLPWNFFASAFSDTGMSLLINSNLLTKVYFPRLIIPCSSIIVSVIDFGISILIYAGLSIYYQFPPSVNTIFLPLFFIQLLIVIMGSGFLVAALNVKYRDFRYIIPFVVQIGLYISPVGFDASIVPEKWKLIYYMNPVSGIIDGFRWCLLSQPLYLPGFIVSLLITILLFITGLIYFRKTEKSFTDII